MTLKRKEPLVNNQIYHTFSRSIAGYIVFNSPDEYNRLTKLIGLCRFIEFNYRYSQFSKLELSTQASIIENIKQRNYVLVEIIAYCIMPTHIHLILKQITDDGITKFLGRILNSYAKFFNTKHKRIGPLWSGRFRNVLINDDDQLLHLTRYIHLNPTSTGLVSNPQNWIHSSYHEYIDPGTKKKLCVLHNLFDFQTKEYESFCLDRESYQKDLSLIKNKLIDDYTG